MSDYRYLVDSNALSKLTPNQRAGNFFQTRCQIPEEVLYEARWFRDVEELEAVLYRTTGRVLTILIEVMSTVPDDDTSLVDLYANRGNADPLIVACALDAQREVEQGLFGETWVVVSNDKAVRATAQQFGIEVRTSGEFAVLIQAQAQDLEQSPDIWKDWTSYV